MTAAASLDDAATLVARALAAAGQRVSAAALIESLRGEMSFPALAQCVREQGLEATVVPLRDGDLAFLPAGTIVAFANGELASIRDHRAGGVILERASGARVVAKKSSALTPVMALDVRSPPKETRHFFARASSLLLAEPRAARATFLVALLGLVLVGLALVTPLVTHAALSSALADRAENQLAVLAAAAAAVGLQVGYVSWFRRRALLFLTMKLSERASVDAVTHLLSIPFARLRNFDIGTVQQTASSSAVAAESIPTLAPQALDLLLGATYLAYAALLDPLSALVAGLGGALVIGAGTIAGARRASLQRAMMASIRSEQHALYEVLAGIETVKAEAMEDRALTRWIDRVVAEEGHALALRQQGSRFAALLAVADRLVFASVLLLLARRCLGGAATIADLVVAVQASTSFMMCAEKIAGLPSSLSDYRAHAARAEEAFAEPSAPPGQQRMGPPGVPAFALRDVWFRYEDDAPWVIRSLDLVVQRGESIRLSWPSGAGKSTLLRLLSGLLEPSRGDVLVCGVPAARARKLVAYIPQHATVFPLSILENLRVLSNGAPRARLLHAAEATGLAALVRTWGMGLETIVALNGANLSRGQKQLILLTAAVASEAPVILLDEALAHMDLRLRADLDARSLFEGRTVIAVVHDASPRESAMAREVGPNG